MNVLLTFSEGITDTIMMTVRSCLKSKLTLLIAAVRVTGFVFLLLAGSSGGAEAGASQLRILSPLNNALFPADISPPVVRWSDESDALSWKVTVASALGTIPAAESAAASWRPSPDQWSGMKKLSGSQSAIITVEGMRDGRVVSRGMVNFQTSPDPVAAPIFYREIALPVAEAMNKPQATRWRLGQVSSPESPRVVLEGMKTCANCHAFTPDGKTLGMDVDTEGDKGAYIITDIAGETVFSKDKVITWNDLRRQPGVTSYGLFSQFSPDGRYVVSTVKEYPVFMLLPELGNSQLFFPVRGILGVYDRQEKRFFPLPGADDPDYVQTNPVFSPDGRWIVFALAKAVKGAVDPNLFASGAALFRYDLYRIPFNEGRGGKAEPLRGASDNDRSNYFPKFTPDGRWIVYTQSDSFMIIQPDAELHMIPAEGGTDRLLHLGKKAMNSWHSISPNGRWMVFSSKANGPYTQLWLTHLDAEGRESVPVLLDWFAPADRAANIPEFVNISPEKMNAITNLLGH
ncbi:MAG: hypothetical protein C0402_13875 [Thermodesulfovibrio sp.]|nr:hypothetical protein [Thermodesulfovibrio sp.]